MLNPRSYQVDFHDAVLAEWGHAPWWDGERATSQKTVGDMATSAGKTIAAAMIAQTVVDTLGGRLLFIGDREELLQQPLDKFHKACGIIASIERGADRCSMNADVVISSVQTLSRETRLARFPRDHFTHIIDDEAHRNTDARQKIHAHFPDAKCLGITATAFRKNLADLSQWYPTVAFRLGIFDLVDEGYITPIKVLTVPLKVDLSSVHQRSGDFNQDEVDGVMRPLYPQIAQLIREHAADRRILAFNPLIVSSKEFVEVMNAEGLHAEHCDGAHHDRRGVIEAFERGDFQILSNSQVFSTGVDFIRADCLLNLAPTRSRVEYRQRAGRIMRLIPGTIDPGGVTLPTAEERKAAIAASIKPNCLVLDLLWQVSKIGLAGPASLIAMNEDDEQQVADRIKKQRTPEELQEISRQVQKDREQKLRDALEAAAAEAERRTHRAATLKDVRALILDLHDNALATYEPAMPWEKRPATPKQQELLAGMGFDGADLQAGLASKLLDATLGRQKNGKAPLEAFAALRFMGVEHPESMSLNDAIRKLGVNFPCTFGKKNHGVPLCQVPSSFWRWIGMPESSNALMACRDKHPATYRYYTKFHAPKPQQVTAPQPELAL